MEHANIRYEDGVKKRMLEMDAADRARRRLKRKAIITALAGGALEVIGLMGRKKVPHKHLALPNSHRTEKLPETSESDC